MQIDPELCVGCQQCLPFCPVGAIVMDDDTARIDFDECAECGNCRRSADCPTQAIYLQELSWPRTVRSILSDPLTIAVESGISGRGTEEMKTNEVTGRFKPGMVGVAIEVGRPVIFSVLTTIAAFWPLLLGTGTMGKIMRNIPLVVIMVLFGCVLPWQMTT